MTFLSLLQDELGHSEADSLPGPAGAEARDKGRKGSTCKQLRPLPTFVKSQSSLDLTEKTYVRKQELSQEEVECNEKLFEETMAVLFPEEKMREKFYRDKVSEASLPLSVGVSRAEISIKEQFPGQGGGRSSLDIDGETEQREKLQGRGVTDILCFLDYRRGRH